MCSTCVHESASPACAQAAVLLQGLLARRPEQRLTVSKALHIMASLEDSH